MERKQLLLDQIRTAFSSVDRKDAISLHEATALDGYASPAQLVAARAIDTDNSWHEVPDQHIEENYSVFSFLDIKGHVYYAPAYMTWFIKNGYETTSNSVDAAQYAFDPRGKYENGRYHLPHEMFTEPQCRAIASYLLYIYEVLDKKSSCSSVKEYLDQYWRKYL